MNNHDILIKKLLWNSIKNVGNKNYRIFNHYPNKYKNIRQYLLSRYNDAESFHESLMRIVYNIEIRPVCPICGGKVKYIGKPNSKGIFTKHCSNSCSSSNKETIQVRENTCIKKYNNKTYNNTTKAKQTKFDKYGDENYNNRNKAIKTNMLLYGGPAPICNENIKKIILSKTRLNTDYKNRNINYDIVFKHMHETNKKRYNDPFYNNRNKTIQTNIEKYGYETPLLNKDIQEKIKQTNIKKYGVDNPSKSDKIKEKIKQTNIKKYDAITPLQQPHIIELIKSNNVKEKRINTKRKNNSFNTSKPEKRSLQLLYDKYGKDNVFHNYKDDKYPFMCDAYIKKLDLYIEFNYHWTHGNHLYNPNNIDDINKIKLWEAKNTKFYDNAITTWTIRDVNKYNIAIQNNLNYLIFYNEKDFMDWFNNL